MYFFDIKYLAVSAAIAIGLVVILYPTPGVEEYTTIEQRIGKMPRDFAKQVRAHYKERDVKIYEVTCYGVYDDNELNGWVAPCSYKMLIGGGIYQKRFDKFLINNLTQKTKML